MNQATPGTERRRGGRWHDAGFFGGLGALTGVYVVLILALLVADFGFTSMADLGAAIASREILYAVKLSLLTCTVSAVLSLWVAVPAGYLLSRYNFPGRRWIDLVIDIPIVLPPLVVGLSLLILFQTVFGRAIENALFPVTYQIPAVILAQFTVACAFAVRTMRVCFSQISARPEQVARTLGCSRGQAFFRVTLPQARQGIVSAGILAWARSLGEFGPILVFAGATRMKTEVLPTTVFLELSVGNLEAALAVSLLMVATAAVVLGLARLFGMRGGLG